MTFTGAMVSTPDKIDKSIPFRAMTPPTPMTPTPQLAYMEYCLLRDDRQPVCSDFESLSPLHWMKVRDRLPIFVCVTGEALRAFKFSYARTCEHHGKDMLVYEHSMGVYRDMGIVIHENGPPQLLATWEVVESDDGRVEAIHWQYVLTSTYMWSKFFFANVFGLKFGFV